MMTPQQKFERIFHLIEEIEYAKAQLQPHDTGHINTAISWMDHRLKQLREEVNGKLQSG